jgi:hypothetical protein
MPTQLTPEQLAQLYAQFQAGNYNLNEGGFAPTAVVHSGEDAGNPSQLLGYTGNYSDPKNFAIGSTYDMYGTNGDYAGRQQVQSSNFHLNDFKDLGQAILLLGSMYLGGQGLAAMGAGSAGGLGGSGFAAGAGAGTEAGIGGGTLGGSGAFLGEGAASGIPAWDGALANAGVGGAGSGLAGETLSKAALDGTNAFGANSAPGAFDLASVGGGATTGGGLLNTITNALPSGAKDILGIGSTLLGAAAGSQPQKTSQSTTRDIPEALKPYVYGQGGLLPSAQNLFQQQIANPQGWQQMSQTGLGLLSQPIAGNGYAQFAAMPRFGR